MKGKKGNEHEMERQSNKRQPNSLFMKKKVESELSTKLGKRSWVAQRD